MIFNLRISCKTRDNYQPASKNALRSGLIGGLQFIADRSSSEPLLYDIRLCTVSSTGWALHSLIKEPLLVTVHVHSRTHVNLRSAILVRRSLRLCTRLAELCCSSFVCVLSHAAFSVLVLHLCSDDGTAFFVCCGSGLAYARARASMSARVRTSSARCLTGSGGSVFANGHPNFTYKSLTSLNEEN